MKRKIIIASLVTMIAGMGYLGINVSNSHFNLSDQQISNVEALSQIGFVSGLEKPIVIHVHITNAYKVAMVLYVSVAM